MGKSGTPMRAHDDQIHGIVGDHIENLLDRMADL
jgi:hypothetical protein